MPQVREEGRFSTRYAYAINPSSIVPQPCQDMVQGNGGELVRIENKIVIVTVGTAKVAQGKKQDRADFSRPVDKRCVNEAENGLLGSHILEVLDKDLADDGGADIHQVGIAVGPGSDN